MGPSASITRRPKQVLPGIAIAAVLEGARALVGLAQLHRRSSTKPLGLSTPRVHPSESVSGRACVGVTIGNVGLCMFIEALDRHRSKDGLRGHAGLMQSMPSRLMRLSLPNTYELLWLIWIAFLNSYWNMVAER